MVGSYEKTFNYKYVIHAGKSDDHSIAQYTGPHNIKYTNMMSKPSKQRVLERSIVELS